MKQAHTESVLQSRDALADGRACELHAGGSLHETARLHCLDEGGYAVESVVHDWLLKVPTDSKKIPHCGRFGAYIVAPPSSRRLPCWLTRSSQANIAIR